MRFDGQVAIVTGAGGALGRSHALALARRGARLVVNDPGRSSRGDGHSEGVALRVVAEITALGGTAIANFESIADRDGARSLVEQAMDAFGRVDVLINNAGAMRDRSFGKMDLDDFDAVVDVNLNGTAYVTHAVFPIMLGQGYGRIVMTTSASGLYGVFGAANYCAAKMGVVGLMNALRIEGERHGVLSNAVAPIAASRLTDGFIDEKRLARMSPACVTPIVVYLASGECSVSGEIYAAGGGYFSRVAIMEGRGIRLPVDDAMAPELIRQRLGEIRDMTQPRLPRSVLDAVDYLAGD